MRFPSILALVQGTYFLVTGVWPLISIRTFEAATGPKTDDWLVKTVGILISVVGATLIVAGWRNSVTAEVVVLAAGSSLALAGVDIWYVVRKTIPPIYLADAAVEILLMLLWAAALTA